MQLPRPPFTAEQWMRYLVAPMLGIAAYKAVVFLGAYATLPEFFGRATWPAEAARLALCLGGGYAVVELNIAVTRALDRYWTWEQQPLFRSFLQFVIVTALTFAAVLVGQAMWYAFDPEQAAGPFFREPAILRNGTIGVFMALIGTGIYLAMQFFGYWKRSLLETERYKAAAAEAQLAALKAQLDPHFLFNSLNTLTELVETQSPRAADFLRNFSQVYRYVLQTRDRPAVSLREELAFADAYLFLLETRFDAALRVERQIDPAALDHKLPPMTLQLLLENAVKHNRLSPDEPLYIRLRVGDGMLTVENNLQEKSGRGFSSGLGLESVSTRVRHLTHRETTARNDGSVFRVDVPLK